MRRASALVIGCALIAVSCGGSSDGGNSADTASPVATEASTDDSEPAATNPAPTEPEPVATDAPEPPSTDAPPATEPPPPPPVNVVGLLPLPGAQLDFSAQAVAVPSLVWSLFEGSGGLIVENIGGPIPPGCHGTSFFDPETFDLLQIDGADAHAYATRGVGGCANMQQDLEAGVVDGDAVTVNNDDLIVFDFGALPEPPFDVSTQIVNPEGGSGIFRAADPDAPILFADFSGNDYAAGVTGAFGIDPDTGQLSRVVEPETAVGPGCDEFSACFQNGRMQVDITNVEGSPGSLLTSGDNGGAFFFFDPESFDVLVSVINGCDINNHFWMFAATATNVEYDLTVTDTSTGESRTYTNSLGSAADAVVDTEAFATCP